jgi:hypothetical protein
MLHFAREHYVEILSLLGGFAWGWIAHSILNAVFSPIMRLFQTAKIRVERVEVPVAHERKEPTGDIVEMFKRRKSA